MPSNNNCEARLIDVLSRQKELYLQVIPVAVTVAEQLESGSFPQTEFESMMDSINQIRELDQQVISDRDRVDSQNLSPNSTLPGLKVELEKLVTQLLGITNAIEERIKSAKDQLAPNMSRQVVASKMNRAYSR